MHKSDLNHRNIRLQEKLRALYALRRTQSKINWDSGLYLELLQHFRSPHLSLPPVIHVAGTNGKGSVVAMLRSILEAQGYVVHAYTSPHLIEVNERIVLAGKQIDDDLLESMIDEAMNFIGDQPLSFFEVMTAIAFRLFSQVYADVVLLEVGMGGRLDCTNIFKPAPLVSVISRISMDHIEFLGNTIADIAREKGGIIKDAAPCVVGFQGSGDHAGVIQNVIREIARKKNSDIHFYGTDFRAHKLNDRMFFAFGDNVRHYPLPALDGEHQIYNAGLVLAALEKIRDALPVEAGAVDKGLRQIQWLGRLQRLDSKALGLNDRVRVWLDSGHNDSAAESLADYFGALHGEDKAHLHVITGMLATKDINRFLKGLAPRIARLSLVPIRSEGAGIRLPDINPDFMDRPFTMVTCSDVEEALHYYKSVDTPTDILICGSVYLAGQVLAAL